VSDVITASVGSVLKGLADLEKKVQKSYIRKALRAAAKPTNAECKARCPEFTGASKKAIKTRSGGTRNGTMHVLVGVSKKWVEGYFYMANVAFGHRVGNARLGDGRKLLAPEDWATDAYNATKGEAIVIFRETIKELIDRGE
jgi:HK97 gp10 family phage protein